MRKLYQHYVTLSYGLARGKIGWWEKRAERRLRENNFKLGLLEARAFDVYNRVERKLFPRADLSRSWIDPGHKTGTSRQQVLQVVRGDDRDDCGLSRGRSTSAALAPLAWGSPAQAAAGSLRSAPLARRGPGLPRPRPQDGYQRQQVLQVVRGDDRDDCGLSRGRSTSAAPGSGAHSLSLRS